MAKSLKIIQPNNTPKSELDALRKKSFGERHKIMQERARRNMIAKQDMMKRRVEK